MKARRISHQARRRGDELRSQRGAVLVVGLIFLALLTLIGVTAFSVATQEERMAGNARDRLRAFEAAETALRECEALIAGPIPPAFTVAGTGGYYLVRQTDQDVIARSGFSWASSPTVTVSGVASVARQPRCVIEQLDGVAIPASGKSIRAELPQSTGTAYRVTAQAVGTNANTAVVLQSYFQRD
jgi:type IV pilus assembly protein PilX